MRNVKLNQFLETYKAELIKSHETNPQDYWWPISELEQVFTKMSSAIERDSFNKDSPAFKRTCKTLGIKHTYTAIRAFINETNEETSNA